MSFALFILLFFPSSFALPSCLYPPCKYDVNRHSEDMTGINVIDNSNHSMSWSWEVRGGKWNVTYKSTFPGGWYEGKAMFINCSTVLDGREQAFVSWGYGKDWESNAIRVYANAWNISYNGEVFGFIPSGYGRYIFKIFSKNKRHNPFGDDIRTPPSCSLTSSDKNEMARWWAQKKQRNCLENVLNWSWNSERGRWKVVYKWLSDTDKTVCSVRYRSFVTSEEMEVINWILDVPMKTVAYRTNPMRIPSEPPWELSLSPGERWGFTPTGNGQWIFQHFSRNLIFRPFNSFSGTISI